MAARGDLCTLGVGREGADCGLRAGVASFRPWRGVGLGDHEEIAAFEAALATELFADELPGAARADGAEDETFSGGRERLGGENGQAGNVLADL